MKDKGETVHKRVARHFFFTPVDTLLSELQSFQQPRQSRCFPAGDERFRVFAENEKCSPIIHCVCNPFHWSPPHQTSPSCERNSCCHFRRFLLVSRLAPIASVIRRDVRRLAFCMAMHAVCVRLLLCRAHEDARNVSPRRKPSAEVAARTLIARR